MRIPLLAVGLSIAVASAANAQSLAARVASANADAVTFHYDARAGVCGDGDRFIRIGRSYHGSVSSLTKRSPCDFGPVQIRLTLRDDKVERVETFVGRLRSRDARDLGEVPAKEAAQYLMGIASRIQGGGEGSKAILGAVIAEEGVIWPSLLEIARDKDSRSRSVRQEAMMWLARYAGAAQAGHPNDIFLDDDSDDEKEDVQGHAVFLLTQLPDRGVTELLEVARTNKSASVRSKALFWLSQSGDTRAVDLFEKLLRG